MASPASVAAPVAGKSLFAYTIAFTVHTLVAYSCALHLSAWLVFHWFGWIALLLHTTISIPATDWYLQHFELVTLIPALVLGYVNVVRFLPAVAREYLHESRTGSAAFWTWTIPTLVLLYRMLQYHAPSSVLYSSSMTAIRYFFDIQNVMPTFSNPLASDPEQVWAQMSVTAPFYAGVAYSLGVLASKHSLLTKFFVFEKKDESTSASEL
ncbi:MAG TPA: hypothetical protein VMT53_07580 [Terriglobales bacterium]|nr:hypothetical protein [Terriglobales bacterium]